MNNIMRAMKIDKIMRTIKKGLAFDKDLPVPKDVTVCSAGVGKAGISLSWQKGQGGWQVGVRNESNNKWTYHITRQPQLDLPLEPGTYLILVRAYKPDGKSIYGPWTANRFFSILGDGTVLSDGQALLHHPRRGKFYRNAHRISQAIADGRPVLDTSPIGVSLILEGRGCNLKCFYCTHIIPNRWIYLASDKTFTKGFNLGRNGIRAQYIAGKTVGTPQSLIDSVFERADYIQTLMFGGSEPTLYPEFWDILRKLQNKSTVQLSVCTNAMLLDEEAAKLIIGTNFPWLRVSMDGATAQTLEAIRNRSDFDKIVSNLKRIVSLRDVAGKKNPRLQFNFVCCRANYHEIPNMVDLAQEIGVSAINFKMLIKPGFEGSPLNKPFEGQDPLPDRNLCAEILSLMVETRRKAAKAGIRLPAEGLTSAIYARWPELTDSQTLETILIESKDEIFDRAEKRKQPGGYLKPAVVVDYMKDLELQRLQTIYSRPFALSKIYRINESDKALLLFSVDDQQDADDIHVFVFSNGHTISQCAAKYDNRLKKHTALFSLGPGRYGACYKRELDKPKLSGFSHQSHPLGFTINADLSVETDLSLALTPEQILPCESLEFDRVTESKGGREIEAHFSIRDCPLIDRVLIESVRTGEIFHPHIDQPADDSKKMMVSMVIEPGPYLMRIGYFTACDDGQSQEVWFDPFPFEVSEDHQLLNRYGSPLRPQDSLAAVSMEELKDVLAGFAGVEKISESNAQPTALPPKAEPVECVLQASPNILDMDFAGATNFLDEELSRTSTLSTTIDWKNVFCHMPFINISAGHHRMHFCCYAKAEFNSFFFAGDDLTIMDLWNHPKIVQARKYMLAGRADLICREDCPHLRTGGVKSPFISNQ